MKTPKDILATEFSEEFVARMKNRMCVSYFKYGKVADNASVYDCVQNVRGRLANHELDGNTEWLIDAANFAMIEYMHPQHSNAHFRATDSSEAPKLAERRE